jgi:phosphatidylglycerol:prolipoprotein diacylglycerol transferase
MHLIKKEKFKSLNKDLIDEYFFWGILSLVIGGRVFSCLVYNFKEYVSKPLEIFLPFTDIKPAAAGSIVFFIIAVITAVILIVLIKNKKIKSDMFWKVMGILYIVRIIYSFAFRFDYYGSRIMEIVLPFTGNFSGYAGMAYHGAVIGVFTASVIFVIVKKINFRLLCDLIFPCIPLGYTFGRLGNFANGELWGRITSSPIGILFPNADKVPLYLPQVKSVIEGLGWNVNLQNGIVTNHAGQEIQNLLGNMIINNANVPVINLPRHPSQLYEAFFEGVFLFLIIWFVAMILQKKFNLFKGLMCSVYLCGYAIVRFFIEFFREPDNQFQNIEAGKYTGYIFANLSMGQILCILMFLFGIGVGVYFYFLSKKDEEIKQKPNVLKAKK